VNFSHKNHLLKSNRNITLIARVAIHACYWNERAPISIGSDLAQCHPNMEQGEKGHIVVTTSTCFTCHFRDVPGNNSISGCPSCHGPPNKRQGIIRILTTKVILSVELIV